jgi:chorismate synthase
MLALVVMEHVLRNRAQCGDVQAQAGKTEAASPQASFL